MAEIRIMSEGTLWWVQASGSGRTWATATSPASGLLAYVTDFTYTSAQDVVTVMERNIPDHIKVVGKQPPTIKFGCLWTGAFPTALTASGASVPLMHLEYRASAPEIGNGTTGVYHQFMGVAPESIQFTENKEGNKIDFQARALAMTGPTGSGFIK